VSNKIIPIFFMTVRIIVSIAGTQTTGKKLQ